MTSRERLLTALSHKVPDRVPRDFPGFNREAYKVFKDKTGSDDPQEYFKADSRYASVRKSKYDLNEYRRFYRRELPGSAVIEEWGTAHIPGSDPAFDHFVAPLVWAESIKDIEEYPLSDLAEEYRYEDLQGDVRKIHSRGLAVSGAMHCTIFEVAWQIRGFNELMTDFISDSPLAGCLLDSITDLRCFQAARFAESGVDVLQLGDDVGMQDRLMMSPQLWRRWFKARLARVIASARKINPGLHIFYHSDGYVEPIIGDLIEIGITALNPVQPECMDPEKLKKEYGKDLAFWGTIGTQTTMPFGTPDDVKEEVQKRIETLGAGGGLVVCPTHVIEPEVPWENVLALFEALDQYGNY